MRTTLILILSSVFVPGSLRAAETLKEPLLLIPAKDTSAFYSFVNGHGVDKDPDKVFTWTGGILRVSGTKGGYVATKAEYSEFRLVAEYKWGKASPENDSGIFIHCVGPDKIWMQSLEIQIADRANTKTGDLVLLGGPTTKVEVDGKPRQSFASIPRKDSLNYEKPIGEWNTIEILSKAGNLEIRVNGKTTMEAKQVFPTAGKIFLQSNKNEIFFRRFELHPAG